MIILRPQIVAVGLSILLLLVSRQSVGSPQAVPNQKQYELRRAPLTLSGYGKTQRAF
jgi:hypothetical protein